MNKCLLLITGSIIMYYNAAAQWKAGVEQYSYMGTQLPVTIVPMCHIQSANNWYAELRYNYEDLQTFSLYGGKTVTGGSGLEYSITPMAGLSTGRFTGVSFAANVDAEWKNIYLSSQMQYSLAVKKNTESFFYNWSELGYNVTPHFFTGITIQYTRQAGETDCKPGLLAGVNFKSFSFPFYVFNPFLPGGYFVLGASYEYSFRKKSKQPRS